MIYTQTWFKNKGVEESFNQKLKTLIKPNAKILEIGAFEGMSTIWFLENIEGSHVTVVDTFKGDQQNIEMTDGFVGIKEHFLSNIEPYKDRVRIIQGDSRIELPEIKGGIFDVVYVDGSHADDCVWSDAISAYRLVKKGGLILFDDYQMTYTDNDNVYYAPKKMIDKFIAEYPVQILHTEWQLWARK